MYNTDVEEGLTFRFLAGGIHSMNSDCKNPIRLNWQEDVIRWRCWGWGDVIIRWRMKKKKGGKNAGYNGHHPPVSNTRYFWHYLFSERFAFIFWGDLYIFSRDVESPAKNTKRRFLIAKDKILGRNRRGSLFFYGSGQEQRSAGRGTRPGRAKQHKKVNFQQVCDKIFSFAPPVARDFCHCHCHLMTVINNS